MDPSHTCVGVSRATISIPSRHQLQESYLSIRMPSHPSPDFMLQACAWLWPLALRYVDIGCDMAIGERLTFVSCIAPSTPACLCGITRRPSCTIVQRSAYVGITPQYFACNILRWRCVSACRLLDKFAFLLRQYSQRWASRSPSGHTAFFVCSRQPVWRGRAFSHLRRASGLFARCTLPARSHAALTPCYCSHHSRARATVDKLARRESPVFTSLYCAWPAAS